MGETNFATIDILVEGYAYPTEYGYIASPTVTLVQTSDVHFIVDPGANATKLLEALSERNLQPSDVNFIFLSHYHPDHFLCLGLFPGKDVYDGTMLWRNDEEYAHKGVIPGTTIEVLPTPGHSPEHTALLVHTDEGVVCIAQDVFWWEDGKQDSDTEKALLDLQDPFVTDQEALHTSRKLVLMKADWIIPGHGKKFRNPTKTATV